MDKATEASERNEEQALMLEDDVSDDQSTQQDELNFPWALVNGINDLKETIQSKPKSMKYWLLSFHFQLLIVFCTCIICIVVGFIILNTCYCHHVLGVVFIVEGACGVCIVVIHVCALIFEWTPSEVMRLSARFRRCIRIIIIFGQLLTVFCILWFFIGHVWFIHLWFNRCYWNGCESKTRIFTVIMVIIQYIIGIWIVYCRLWDTKRVLHGLKRIIEHRLDQFPHYDQHLDTQESIPHSKNTEGDHNTTQRLTLI